MICSKKEVIGGRENIGPVNFRYGWFCKYCRIRVMRRRPGSVKTACGDDLK